MKKNRDTRRHLAADAQDRVLSRRSNPQMTVVEQKRDA